MSAEPLDRWADDGGAYDWAALHDPYLAAQVPAPSREEMAADRAREDNAAYQRGQAMPRPVLAGPVAVMAPAWPDPVDCGTATLSPLGDVHYVSDLVIPGRILLMAAEEGTGKTYAGKELSIRTAVAGGAFAETWEVEQPGPVAYLSEMHPDDDWRYEQDVLDALGVLRWSLTGQMYRWELGTAAHGRPVLTDAAWRAWFGEWCRKTGIRLAIFDTGTMATQVDPWGRDMQQVFADLRGLLAECPELAVALVVHLKKPAQGRTGARRITDVLGDWTKWCDVLLLMEDGGPGRTRLSTRKRVRQPRSIVATRSHGLLVEPHADTIAAPAAKVPQEDVLAAITASPGITYVALAARVGVGKATASRYVAALGAAVTVVDGTRSAPARLYPRDAQVPQVHQVPQERGDAPVRHLGTGEGGEVHQVHHHPYGGDALPDAPTFTRDSDDLTTEAASIFGDMA